MAEAGAVCDAEIQLDAEVAASHAGGGQGGEQRALLGEVSLQRSAWSRLPAAGLATLLLVGAGACALWYGGGGAGSGVPTRGGGAALEITQLSEECSLHGGAHDCSETKCCQGPHMVCFEKNEHYGTCRESCVVGIHHDDPQEHQTAWSCKPLSKHEGASPPVGKTITLKSHHGKFLTADRFNEKWVKAGTEVADDWERFVVKEVDDTTVALLTHHKDFVACEKDGGIRADRHEINAWEKFIWVGNSDGTVSLLAHTGKYLKATPEGVLKADAHLIDDWEKFTVEEVEDTASTSHCSKHGDAYDCSETKCCQDPHRVCFEKNEHYGTCQESCVRGIHLDDPKEHQTAWSCKPLSEGVVAGPPIGKKIALKSFHGKYVVAHQNGLMEANKDEANSWEKFAVSSAGEDHMVSLKSEHGFYAACESHGTVLADRDVANTWEKFIWVDNSDGTVSLLCHTGKYWNAPPGGHLKAEASFVGSYEEFQVETFD